MAKNKKKNDKNDSNDDIQNDNTDDSNTSNNNTDEENNNKKKRESVKEMKRRRRNKKRKRRGSVGRRCVDGEKKKVKIIMINGRRATRRDKKSDKGKRSSRAYQTNDSDPGTCLVHIQATGAR